MRGRPRLIVIATLVVLAGFGLWRLSRVGASDPGRSGSADRTVPVTMATVVTKSEPIELHAIGLVEAFTTVDVHPQVSGQLTRVEFHEGDTVHKGDVLFGVDARSNQADVAGAQADYDRAVAVQRQAEATLAKDQVLAKTAELEAKRYAQLADSGVVSREQYDLNRSTADASAATVMADTEAVRSARKSADSAHAALDASKIQLGYTTITAPMDGKTGALLAHQGDVVGPNDAQPLVVIAQIAPVYVTFAIPEAQLPALKGAMAKGDVRVLANVSSDMANTFDGTLSFLDSAVDTSTGTIKLKATFANGDHALWPGQFVNATVVLGTEDNAVVAPSVAVQTGQQGTFVFVVQTDGTVAMRPITVARVAGDEAVIAAGLAPGDRVVTDGQLRLAPGVHVRDAGAAS